MRKYFSITLNDKYSARFSEYTKDEDGNPWDCTNMNFYLGAYVDYEDYPNNFEMSLDQIAHEKMAGLTDELSPADFPCLVNYELDSYCSFGWLKGQYLGQLLFQKALEDR